MIIKYDIRNNILCFRSILSGWLIAKKNYQLVCKILSKPNKNGFGWADVYIIPERTLGEMLISSGSIK